MTLPADVPTSLVQGTYSIAAADNADTGIEPQGAPLDGLQIVLTPDPPRVWTHTSSGAGVAIGPMLATTNSLGVLVNPVTGLVGLRIPSSAQAGLTGAPTIPWTAEVSDPLGRVETERKTFHAPAGGTVNLPSVAPYWPDPNAGSIPQWEAAAADARAAIDTYAPQAVDAATRSSLRVVNLAASMAALAGVTSVASAEVRRTGQVVELNIVDVRCTLGGSTVICNLPVGFRPPAQRFIPAGTRYNTSDPTRTVQINTNGDVLLVGVQATPIAYLVALTFSTEQALPSQ